MGQHANMVKVTAAAPGTGSVTVSTAVSGFRTFAQGYNSADATVAGVRIEDASDTTIWEIDENCAYTHSGTTLSRGTRTDSSTGSAVNFTGSVIVSVIATAGFGNNAALNHVTGGDADTTMAVGNMYVTDMSGWATADRTYTLPAAATVGDRIGIMVTAGDASHELIIKPNTGDTINGGSAAAEWSRLFITGEVVILRCVAADSAWVVEYDGRIPCVAKMQAASAQTGITSGAWTTITQGASGSWATPINIGAMIDATNHRVVARRAGRYSFTLDGNMTGLDDQKEVLLGVTKNGTGNPLRCARIAASSPTNAGYPQVVGVIVVEAAANDYYVAQILHTHGSNLATDWISGELQNAITAVEIL